jgi:hypothetical protein
MTGILLSAEQVRSAPVEVRSWLRGVLEAELGWEAHEIEAAGTAVAACSPEEAEQILDRIRDDYLSTQVFFELGRDQPPAAGRGDLHRASFLDIARHTRVADFQQLSSCLETITAAFREIRRDPDSNLFAFDQRGGLYMHAVTHQSIARLWHAIVARQPSAQSPAEARSAPPMRAAATPLVLGD